MKVVLFGATGMVGHGVLLECLADPAVSRVLTIGRRATGVEHEKLEEVVHDDFADYSHLTDGPSGFDACFFCLGSSAVGSSEESYRRVNQDFPLAAAGALSALNPDLVFCYVSGEGTDSTAAGRVMWARIKGETENELLAMPLRDAYMFRPGYIHPVKGVKPPEGWLRVFYALLRPLYPVLKRLFARHVTTSDNLGRAMIRAGRQGYSSPILENDDINALAQAG